MLDNIKILLGLEEEISERQEELLTLILNHTTQRLKNRLGKVEEVPDELKYIVEDVAVKRFNRIASEGATSHTVEGETWSFNDDDFAEFEADIAAYLSSSPTGGGIKFL